MGYPAGRDRRASPEGMPPLLPKRPGNQAPARPQQADRSKQSYIEKQTSQSSEAPSRQPGRSLYGQPRAPAPPRQDRLIQQTPLPKQPSQQNTGYWNGGRPDQRSHGFGKSQPKPPPLNPVYSQRDQTFLQPRQQPQQHRERKMQPQGQQRPLPEMTRARQLDVPPKQSWWRRQKQKREDASAKKSQRQNRLRHALSVYDASNTHSIAGVYFPEDHAKYNFHPREVSPDGQARRHEDGHKTPTGFIIRPQSGVGQRHSKPYDQLVRFAGLKHLPPAGFDEVVLDFRNLQHIFETMDVKYMNKTPFLVTKKTELLYLAKKNGVKLTRAEKKELRELDPINWGGGGDGGFSLAFLFAGFG